MPTVPITTEELVEWRARVRSARARIEAELPQWRRVHKAYNGQALPEEEEGADSARINYILSTMNAVLPGIIAQDPFLHVKARRRENVSSARKSQSALNWAWRKSKATRDARNAIRDTLMYGIGVGRTEFDAPGQLPARQYTEGPIVAPQEQLTPEQRAQIAEAPPEVAMSGPTPFPRLRRVAPWCLLVPDGIVEVDDMDWIGEDWHKTPSDLRNDPLGRFEVPEDLEPTHHLTSGPPRRVEAVDFDGSGHNEEKPTVVRVTEIIYFREEANGTLRRTKLWLLDTDDLTQAVLHHEYDDAEAPGYPFFVMRFAADNDSFYATDIADLGAVMGPVRRLNNVLGYMFRHNAAQRPRIMLVANELLDEGELEAAIEDGEDGTVVGVSLEGDDIRKSVMLLPEAPPPSDTAFVVGKLESIVREQSGVGVLQRGGQQRKGATATEATIANKGFEDRSQLRLANVDDFIEAVAERMLADMRQYWDTPVWVRVAGDHGDDDFEPIRGNDIVDELDVEILSGSTLPMDPGSQQQAFMGLLSGIREITATLQPLAALTNPDGSPLIPDIGQTIQLFIQQAFSVFRQDERAMMGPLAGLASRGLSSITSSSGSPEPPSGDQAGGGELAGFGPRPGAGGIALVGGNGGPQQ